MNPEHINVGDTLHDHLGNEREILEIDYDSGERIFRIDDDNTWVDAAYFTESVDTAGSSLASDSSDRKPSNKMSIQDCHNHLNEAINHLLAVTTYPSEIPEVSKLGIEAAINLINNARFRTIQQHP